MKRDRKHPYPFWAGAQRELGIKKRQEWGPERGRAGGPWPVVVQWPWSIWVGVAWEQGQERSAEG